MTDKTAAPGPDDHGAGPKPPAVKLTQDGFTNARDQVLWEIRGEIAQTAGILLQRLDEVGMFNGGINPHDWLYERPPARVLADTEAIIADVREYAQEAEDALASIQGCRIWLASGRPLRCYACGQPIDPEHQEWRIDDDLDADGLTAHEACHHRDRAVRAANLAATVAEDHYAAICEDRTRTARPQPGDVVELALPDGQSTPEGPTTCTVQGVWHVSVDAAFTRVEVTTSPTGTPAVGELVDPLDAEAVRVIWLADQAPTTPADGRPVGADVAHLAPLPQCGRSYNWTSPTAASTPSSRPAKTGPCWSSRSPPGTASSTTPPATPRSCCPRPTSPKTSSSATPARSTPPRASPSSPPTSSPTGGWTHPACTWR
jgi:hypothetical protein